MKRSFRWALMCGLILCVSGAAAYAAEYEVKQDGTGDFTRIQEAIDAAKDGDVIVVHPGTYRENIHFDGKNITLRSLDPDKKEIVASTIIDGGQRGSVVTFSGAEKEKCLLSGFTITKGDTGDSGGGICGAGTSAGISSCVVTGNSAGAEFGCGGGLYSCNGSIRNCTISGNAADYGGGLDECEGTISNCTIGSNSARYGGGLYGCSCTISNSAISGNTGDYGGGLNSCSGTISNCTIAANWALYGGGLAWCDHSFSSNCTISDNSAQDCGGGLYRCLATIVNCIVWGNEAAEGPEVGDRDYPGITYSCVRGWTGGGEGNISDDPLFVKGPLGDYYLSCSAAGQVADSPCIDAGSAAAESLGLDKLTTRTDEVPDAGVVDMGYHYPLTLGQNPQIECSLNESEFAPGDTLVGFIEEHNPGPDVTVDIYIAFVMPNGAIISLTGAGLTMGIYARASNVLLPSGVHFGPAEAFRTTVPQWPGSYLFAAALTNPGEFVFIGDPSLFPFTIKGGS